MTVSQSLPSPTRGRRVSRRQGQSGRPRPLAHSAATSTSGRTLRSAHPLTAPAWVGALRWWQRTSTVMAFLSCSTVLGIYTWTVHTQERWNQQYEALQQMRRHERQFLLSQESIANSLRETADRSDMVPLVPERMIEVPIASPRPAEKIVSSSNISEQKEPFFPVGY